MILDYIQESWFFSRGKLQALGNLTLLHVENSNPFRSKSLVPAYRLENICLQYIQKDNGTFKGKSKQDGSRMEAVHRKDKNVIGTSLFLQRKITKLQGLQIRDVPN